MTSVKERLRRQAERKIVLPADLREDLEDALEEVERLEGHLAELQHRYDLATAPPEKKQDSPSSLVSQLRFVHAKDAEMYPNAYKSALGIAIEEIERLIAHRAECEAVIADLTNPDLGMDGEWVKCMTTRNALRKGRRLVREAKNRRQEGGSNDG